MIKNTIMQSPTSYVTAGICLCLKNTACGNARNRFALGSARSWSSLPKLGRRAGFTWIQPQMCVEATSPAGVSVFSQHSYVVRSKRHNRDNSIDLPFPGSRAIQRKLFATLEKLLVRRWAISRKKCQKELSVCVVPWKAHGRACLKTSRNLYRRADYQRAKEELMGYI